MDVRTGNGFPQRGVILSEPGARRHIPVVVRDVNLVVRIFVAYRPQTARSRLSERVLVANVVSIRHSMSLWIIDPVRRAKTESAQQTGDDQ